MLVRVFWQVERVLRGPRSRWSDPDAAEFADVSRTAAELVLGQFLDRDPQVRVAATRAYGELAGVEGADRVASMLQDPQPDVVVQARETLAGLKDMRSFEPMR